MPFASFKRVREVSSEDNVYLAENLIKCPLGRKWKTKNVGEKSAYVILEMSDSYKVTGIDIGNEHSAFIEILVGKLGYDPGDFKEILITCAFMTPTESKSSNNINRVRCFNRDELVSSVVEDKWSLVKILCKQPFNKHVPYGLSFIKIHIDDNTKNSSITQKNIIPEEFLNATTQVIGNLKFRGASPDSESENSSSLFNRWKKLKHDDKEQTIAASKDPITLVPCCFNDDNKPKTLSLKKHNDMLDRNREKLLFGDETDETNKKTSEKLKRLSAHIEKDKKRRRLELEKEMNKIVSDLTTKPSSSKTSYESNICVSLESINKQQSLTQKNVIKSNKPLKNSKPFNQLLTDVVLVISGIQNPDRGDLRNKAIALGAKYKGDWDDTCTHLICAFKNTPKYNQVKGKGKIVTRRWVEKCYSLKKYLPWRRYALDSKELSKPESDEEIFGDTQNYENEKICNNADLYNNSLNKRESEENSISVTLYEYDNDGRCNANCLASILNNSSSESDTDDEINRIKQNNAVQRNSISKCLDVYEASTDEEDYINKKSR